MEDETEEVSVGGFDGLGFEEIVLHEGDSSLVLLCQRCLRFFDFFGGKILDDEVADGGVLCHFEGCVAGGTSDLEGKESVSFRSI